MKKKLTYYIIATIVFLAISVFVFPYFTHLNRCWPDPSDIFFVQEGTVWKSNKPKIEIVVCENDRAYGTISIGNELIDIEFFYAELDVIMFEDLDKRRKGGYLRSEIDIVVGNCDFSKTKLEIEVTKSNIDEIKVGDEIVLYRQD